MDVCHYANTHTSFPHESTADQWFDETQFESYRQLGLKTGRSIFATDAENSPWVNATSSQNDWVCEVSKTLLNPIEPAHKKDENKAPAPQSPGMMEPEEILNVIRWLMFYSRQMQAKSAEP